MATNTTKTITKINTEQSQSKGGTTVSSKVVESEVKDNQIVPKREAVEVGVNVGISTAP